MSGIAVSPIELLIKGIPESILILIALHVFTETKIVLKKFLLLNLLYLITTYLIRLLPIALGVNTILSLLALILLFLIIYKIDLSKIVRSIVAAIVIITMVMAAEVLNMLLLNIVFGEKKAAELLGYGSALTKSICTIPSTLIFAVFVLVGAVVLARINKYWKEKDGKAGTETRK